MHRPLAIALVLLITLVAGLAWWFSSEPVPPPSPGTFANAAEPAVAAAADGTVAVGEAVVRAPEREAIASRPPDPADDPEIQAGLTGFRGRVVDHKQQPVADCGVRMYRGAMDTMLQFGPDLFTDVQFEPQVVAGEVRTAADGTFLLTGVWPRAFYLLFAGIDTDAPMHQVVTKTPSPGEVVDLGDVVLPNAGILVGTVVDEDDQPVPGALVRCADVPGAIAGFFPIERFDPEGALLGRGDGLPMKVLEMPAWVKPLFDRFPIPTDTTDSEGKFRLVGVVPGSNMVATTQRGYLSDVKPSVPVKAGQTKDVGKIKLKRGEELVGRVVDSAGKPVAGAEILAGSTLVIGPVDLAQRLGTSDADGRFQGQGFAPGKVTVAARRGKGHAWVLAEPQPVLNDVVVTLPALFGVTVTVSLADGKPAPAPRFRLLQGAAGNGAAEMAMFGFVPPLDLRERQQQLAEGQWRIDNLLPGTYTLLADAPGHAAAHATFTLEASDAMVGLQLDRSRSYVVAVLGPDDKPIRNAAIYAQSSPRKIAGMPFLCGRTGADGRLRIDTMQGDSLNVSADHPRWGVVHGEVKVDQEVTLRMQAPGTLTGIVTADGKPAPVGEFTVTVERRRGPNEPRGPIDTVPMLLTPGLDGTFATKALQPGSYRIGAIRSLEALRSPGGMFAMVQEMMVPRDLPRETVELAAGGRAEVRLETGKKPIDGPTATLSGTLTIDGKLAVGNYVTVRGKGRDFSARTDRTGRFDFGTVPAGKLQLTVMSSPDAGFFAGPSTNLWRDMVELAQAETRELTLTVETAAIGGICTKSDGSPAAGVFVSGSGRSMGASKDADQTWIGAPTDSQGKFSFPQVGAGTWSLSVRGEEGLRGKLEGLVVAAGNPQTDLRLVLEQGPVVRGRVDVAGFGDKKPRWAWMSFHRRPQPDQKGEFGDQVDGTSIRMESGEFSTADLPAGEYLVRIHANTDGKQVMYRGGEIVVPPQGVSDLQLRVGAVIR